MKIGGAGSSPNFRLADPVAFGPAQVAEDIQNGKSWSNFTQRLAVSNAREWFAEYHSVPFGEWLREERHWDADGVETLITDFEFLALDAHEVIPKFMRTPDDFGDAVVPLTESPLAQKVLADLQSRGVTGHFITCVPAGGMLIDVETPVAWIGAWETIYGSRCFVRFEVHKDTEGIERVVFSTSLLASTRGLAEDLTREVQEAIVLGFWMQTLFYVAENPFPSAMLSFSRDLSLQEVPVDFRPVPLAWIQPFGLTLTQLGSAVSGQVSIDTSTCPLVLNAGYLLTDSPHLSATIAHAVDALVAASSVVEDGFRNMRNQDSVMSFDQVFASEYDLMGNPIGEVRGYARWIPEPLLGELTLLTTHNYTLVAQEEGDTVQRRAALEWIANFGAGPYAAAAINTLAFSFLIPEGTDKFAQFYLKQAIAMDVLNESTNAMANLGALHIRMGRYTTATEVLLRALDRPDRFAEGEASLLLGRAYRKLGDESAAKTYFERASQSSDETYAQQARDELGSGLVLEPQQRSGRSRFCGQCGSQFTLEAQNFCANCGERRP